MQTAGMAPTAFASKRDAWLVAVIWAGAAAAVAGGVAQYASGAPLVVRTVVLVGLLGGAAFMLWILYGTRYVFRGDELLVSSGPFRTVVPLGEVDSVHPSRDPASSPATSLDRLLVCWSGGRRRVLISPHPRQGFLLELAGRAPHLGVQGDGLERLEERPQGS